MPIYKFGFHCILQIQTIEIQMYQGNITMGQAKCYDIWEVFKNIAHEPLNIIYLYNIEKLWKITKKKLSYKVKYWEFIK